MKKRLHHLSSLIGLCLFGVAILVIHHKLKDYRYLDIVAHLKSTRLVTLLSALGLTILDFLVLTAYDALGLRYIQHRVAYWKLAMASFIGHVFSHNATILGGSAARYRIYSSIGLSATEVAKLVVFCGVTFWLGFFALAGIMFVARPEHIPETLHVPLVSVWPLGVLFLVVVGLYLALVMFRRAPLSLRGQEFSLPSVGLSIGQIAISSIDWLLAAGVLYVLLPEAVPLTFPKFLSAFMLAQTAGLLSYVPGGLGVFETVILLLLGGTVETSAFVGSLLLYRLVYYLLPLFVASGLLASHELVVQREGLKRVGLAFTRWRPAILPQFFAVGVFVAGAILLFSGTLPATEGRLEMLRDLLPLPAIELSHFLGSLSGAGLILLARGLQRRLDAAYHLTLVLLGAGILFSLLKGLDYEEAIALGVMLLALLPCRGQFYRRASLLTHSFTGGWMALVAITLLCAVWLGMFSYEHVEYSRELWWRFTLHGDAPRFLRAMAGAVVLTLLYAVAKLIMPAHPRTAPLDPTDLDAVVRIVEDSPATNAHLALLGDKKFLFSPDKQAFIMYGIEGQSWIAMGDPVGPETQWKDLIWRYIERVDKYDGRPVFYQAEAAHLHYYTELGLTFLKLGEEGQVDLRSFSLEGSARKGLRYSHGRVQKQDCTFAVLPTQEVEGAMDTLGSVSDAWLAHMKTSEKRFSLGCFNPDYLRRGPVAVVRREGRTIAFANMWLGAGRQEMSVDLMRYLPSSPPGVMDYLFIELLLWGKQQGFGRFNFGMAPLSGLESRTQGPLWPKAGALIFRHGEHFYNFQGLRQYKEKFDPQWRPKYLVCQAGLALPRTLANVVTLVSGGVKGIVAK